MGQRPPGVAKHPTAAARFYKWSPTGGAELRERKTRQLGCCPPVRVEQLYGVCWVRLHLVRVD